MEDVVVLRKTRTVACSGCTWTCDGVARPEVLERLDVLGLLEDDTGDVGSPLLDGRDAAARPVQPELDLVGEPVRAGGSRPHAEVGIADERERPSRHVALDHVRARSRGPDASPCPGPACHAGSGGTYGSAPQERRPSGRRRWKTIVPVASSVRMPRLRSQLRGRLLQASAPTSGSLATAPGPGAKRPLERAPEVARLDERPVRVADAAAELEGVPGSAGRDHRQRAREVRHDPACPRSRRAVRGRRDRRRPR